MTQDTNIQRIQKRFCGSYSKLIPYLMAGYPSVAESLSFLKQLGTLDVGAIELGVPFSDPIADGVSIQYAHDVALRNGVRLTDCLNMVSQVATNDFPPILFMVYYNQLYNYGLQEIVKAAADAGVAGFVIPDLPAAESEPLNTYCVEQGLALIRFVTPTSDIAAQREQLRQATGFIYVITQPGVTGLSAEISEAFWNRVHTLRDVTTTPIAAGFGIRTERAARDLAGKVSGVIVGAAIIEALASSTAEALTLCKNLCGALKE